MEYVVFSCTQGKKLKRIRVANVNRIWCKSNPQQSISQTRKKMLVLDSPVDRIFLDKNRMINMCRLFIQVLYSAKICGKQYNKRTFKGTLKQQEKNKAKHSRQLAGADPGFQVRGGALKKIAPSGGRRENIWGISCENSRFYAKKADYRISLPSLTSNSKNKTVVSKLHCMLNLQFKSHFNPLSGYLGVAGYRIILLTPPPGLQ